MTPDQLETIGQAMFGPQWQKPLAREIGMGDRHMRRLAAGESPIVEGVEADVMAAAKRRGEALIAIVAATAGGLGGLAA